MIHEENNDFRAVRPILAISTIRKRRVDLLVCYKNSQGSLSKINATKLNRNGEVQCAQSRSPLVPVPALLSVGQHNLGIAEKLKNFCLKRIFSRLKIHWEFWWASLWRLEDTDWKQQIWTHPQGTCVLSTKNAWFHTIPAACWKRFWCLLSLKHESRCCKSLLQCS